MVPERGHLENLCSANPPTPQPNSCPSMCPAKLSRPPTCPCARRLAKHFPHTQPPALGSELVNCAVVGRASMHGRTVNVSGGINHHSVVGERSAWRTRETISHTLSPCSISTVS